MAEQRDKMPAPPPLRGAIVAVAREIFGERYVLDGNNIIGMDGGLPWHYSEDLKRFKQRTMGCVVIMGRVTWDSIGRKPLPGRRNIVISRSRVAGVECYKEIKQAIEACQDEDLWVIGGGQIYCAAMDYLNLLDVTYVPNSITRADAVKFKFPQFIRTNWNKGPKRKISGNDKLRRIVYRRNNEEILRDWYIGKKIFDTYGLPEKTKGIKSDLDAANIPYYETRMGKWYLGLAGLWVSDTAYYGPAKLVVNKFEKKWAKTKSELAPQKELITED